jgi:hypothetical protein
MKYSYHCVFGVFVQSAVKLSTGISFLLSVMVAFKSMTGRVLQKMIVCHFDDENRATLRIAFQLSVFFRIACFLHWPLWYNCMHITRLACFYTDCFDVTVWRLCTNMFVLIFIDILNRTYSSLAPGLVR